VNDINNKNLTESQFVQDSGDIVSRIKEIIEEASIRIEIAWINGYQKITRPYIEDPV